METRTMNIVKDGGIYIAHLNITTLKLLWKILNKTDITNTELIKCITRYGNLMDQPSLPSLAEVVNLDIADRKKVIDFAYAIRLLAGNTDTAFEVYGGISLGTLPVKEPRLILQLEPSTSTSNKPTMSDAKSNKEKDSPAVDSAAKTEELSIIEVCDAEDDISDITNLDDPPVEKNKATSKQLAKEAGKQRIPKRSEIQKLSTIDKDVALIVGEGEIIVNAGITAMMRFYRQRRRLQHEESLTKSKYKEK